MKYPRKSSPSYFPNADHERGGPMARDSGDSLPQPAPPCGPCLRRSPSLAGQRTSPPATRRGAPLAAKRWLRGRRVASSPPQGRFILRDAMHPAVPAFAVGNGRAMPPRPSRLRAASWRPPYSLAGPRVRVLTRKRLPPGEEPVQRERRR